MEDTKWCDSCLYAGVPRQIERECYCGDTYAVGEVPACPNVCTHQKPVKMSVTPQPTNVALAQREEEKTALEQRYNKIRESKLNQISHLDSFEESIRKSQVIINIKQDVLYKIVVERQPYLNAYTCGEEKPPSEERQKWDKLLFGNCGHNIWFGALCVVSKSAKGEANFLGVTNYGRFGMILKEVEIKERASVCEENSKIIYAYTYLSGVFPQPFPSPFPAFGHRANWKDRSRLAVAKLGEHIDTPMTQEQIHNQLLLVNGRNRDEDKFIEVHLWGGFTWESIEYVVVEQDLTVVTKDIFDKENAVSELGEELTPQERLERMNKLTKAVERQVRDIKKELDEIKIECLTWKTTS